MREIKKFLLEAIEDIHPSPENFIIERETYDDKWGNIVIPGEAKDRSSRNTYHAEVLKCPAIKTDDPYIQQRVDCISVGDTISFYPTTPVTIGVEELRQLQMIAVQDIVSWYKIPLEEFKKKRKNMIDRLNEYYKENNIRLI